MKRTIKIISDFLLTIILLAIILILSNACSKNNDNTSEPEPEPEPTEVTDEAPVWTLSSGQNSYEFNMTYSSQIAFNDITSKNAETIVAAFVGNECRGFTKLTHESRINIYIFNLTIYSNEPSGEDVVIKAYNPDQKKLYDQCTTFKFESDGSKGSVDEILNCVIL